MIRYALACDNGHAFDSWFQNSAAYDKQAKAGLVACPVCNSVKVEKSIMAPRVSGAKSAAMRRCRSDRPPLRRRPRRRPQSPCYRRRSASFARS